MDLEDLRAAQTRERSTDGLQDLRDSFYEDVAVYIEELREQRAQAAEEADDPFGSSEVQDLTDEIETAEQVAEAIYERRIGKLVKQASLAAAGVPDEKEGLTAEERDLYADIVERIQENKSHVLDVIAGEVDPSDGESGSPVETGASPVDSRSSTPDALDETPDASGGSGSSDAPAESSAAAAMGGEDLDAGEPEPESEPEAPPESESEAPPEAPPDVPAQEPAGAGPAAEAEPTAEGEAGEDEGSVERTKVRITQDIGEIFGVDERPYTLEAEDIVTLPRENAEPLVEREAAEKIGE